MAVIEESEIVLGQPHCRAILVADDHIHLDQPGSGAKGRRWRVLLGGR
jgi:hypothetical protein